MAIVDWVLSVVMAIAAWKAWDREAVSVAWLCGAVALLLVQMGNRLMDARLLHSTIGQLRDDLTDARRRLQEHEESRKRILL